ncbi:Rqc2 family fibronectin-binding protein [Paenibacillus tarimensis]|uniref:Rqc2 family fibronectin-binding protein n=1 Tax=Paenibacillus tarimensis TaxID=416012 RepID=UPI001F362C56|nr:NFACT RNA binding domain-containing protein [Paenibacillus tarimensis]MCF2942213.1 NFACT family protein [Paenibacillus tarimensis]
MALDGIVTRALAAELQEATGTRIHKIHQPDEHTLVLQTRGGKAQGKLLISANPTYPRLHWTTASQSNPLEAPMFCMLLRKHCEGGVIEGIRQPGNERVLHFSIRQRDELGDYSLKTVIVELMGRHSNIILVDPASGQIHDGIHHVTPAISSYRIVLPGSSYTAPPSQDKTDPFSIHSYEQFESALEAVSAELAADKRIVAAFSGISPLLAREITHRAGTLGSLGDPRALWDAFAALFEKLARHEYEPVIVTDADGRQQFSVTRLTHLDGETKLYPTISSCLEAYYGDKAERDTVKQRAADLYRFLQNEKSKNVKKLEKLSETLEEAKDADKHRILGELVTAYMHQIKRGDASVEVVNYYSEEQETVTIQLDPQLTPSENAQRYFRRYTKAKNSRSVVSEQMEAAHEEIRYLDTLLQQLDSASLQDIEEIREELVAEGYMRARGRKGPKKKKTAKPALLCYTSSENIAIYVGKNNTQNEYLTNRLASPGDTWLHTKDIPGSHIVIRGQDFGDATLEEAAMLAAHYSQARSSSLVPVDYTLIRHVRKPSGAKPGFVIYDHQKTLFITPDEQRIKSLPSQVKA